ncbi:MAG: hypothetical protein WCI77_06800 [Candidatus Omnitrophota bacterium]
MDYQRILKKELLEKLKRYFELGDQLCRIQAEDGFIASLSLEEKEVFFDPPEVECSDEALPGDREEIPEEIEKQFEESKKTLNFTFLGIPNQHKKLLDEFLILQNEISCLMVECKYYPLTGIDDKSFELLRRKTPAQEINISEAIPSEDSIEKFLEERMITEAEEVKKRIKSIAPLFLDFQIDPTTLYFYQQVLRCYTYGMFEASCVLGRAITETIAKKYIRYKDYGHLLVDKDKENKTMSVQAILKNILAIDTDIVSLYSKIGNIADNILHRKDMVNEERTFEVIKLLQEFLKQFPKSI